jgi:hypothetical protein
MPIIEIKMYTVKCEDCDDYYDGGDDQPEYAVTGNAKSEGWYISGQKCYCPEHAEKFYREN